MIVVVDCFSLEQAETNNAKKVNAMINSVALSGSFFSRINKIPFGIHLVTCYLAHGGSVIKILSISFEYKVIVRRNVAP
jgi:hypothetical protein